MTYAPADHAPPMWCHQREELLTSAHLAERALFWQMRTGKSRPIIDTIAYQFEADTIDAAVVVAWPSAVPGVWVDQEIPAYMPRRIPYRALRWRSSKVGTDRYDAELRAILDHPGLAILAVNCEALVASRACWPYLLRFAAKRRFMFVGDEVGGWCSSAASARTKRAESLARRAATRRILDGSPVQESPFDVFSQCNLLHRGILGFHNVEAFRQRYGKYEVEVDINGAPVLDAYGQPIRMRYRNRRTGGEYHQLIGYQHLDELNAKLLSFGSRVLRSDCADLPPKIYEERRFALTTEQRQVYGELEMDLRASIDGDEVTVKNALARDGRLAMVARGWWPPEERGKLCLGCGGAGCDQCHGEGVLITSSPRRILVDQADNPALEALRGELERHAKEPTIVWCRHRWDCRDALQVAKRAGRRPVLYDGSVPARERDAARQAFQSGEADTFVATPAAAGLGVRLDRAEVLIYYSCAYSARLRAQSEDRAESLGVDAARRGTLVIDLIAEDTIDEHVRAILIGKAQTAARVFNEGAKS